MTSLMRAAALLAGTAVVATAAAAQTVTSSVPATTQDTSGAAAPPVTGGLEDIVVTAERRETNLQSTPISISAVTAAGLQAEGIRNINDLNATLPNLTTTTGPQGSADANFFIRGVGQFDFIATNDPGVGVYVDGVYLGRTVGALIDSSDVARVEVLRGPQGTLFGRNTLGGAISITSKQPKLGDFAVDAGISGGSRSRIDGDASVNVPLGDSAALRVSGFERYQDGFATRAYDGVRFGKTKRYGGRAQLLLKPTDRLTIDLSADYSNDKSNPAPSVLLAIVPAPFFPPGAAAQIQNPNNFYAVNESNSPESKNIIYGFSGTVAYDLGGVTLKSISAYRHLNALSTSDPDGTLYRLYDQMAPTHQEQYSEELQATGSLLDNHLDFVVGAYYFHEKVDQTLFLCFAPITPTPTAFFNACNTWNQGNLQKTDSYAGFGQLRYHFTDALSVTVGGRYTSETKTDISNQAFDFRPAGLQVAPGVVIPGFYSPIVTDLPGRLTFHRFTPKVGAEYQADNNLLLFASWARGFRSGGFNGRLIAPQATIPTYNPDTTDSYEAGIKTDFLDRRVRLNATGFYTTYKGIQQTISVPVTQFEVANAGNADIYGFEAELTVAPIDAFRVNASLGYAHSKFYDVPASAQQSGNINGNRLPFAPEYTAAVGVEYAIPLARLGKLVPRVDYRFQSRTFFTALNLPLEQQAPYGLLSARLTYTDEAKRYSLAVYGDNLTDERYYTFGQNALGAQGVAYNYLGRPREYGVTARVNF